MPNVCFFLSTGFPFDLKMAVHQENFQNFVIFDYHPGEMVWNMEKWQASNPLPVLLPGNNTTLHKLEREVFVQMTPFKFSFKKKL